MNTENNLTAQNRANETAVIRHTDKMSLEQLNEYLVEKTAEISERTRKSRLEYKTKGLPRTSDIVPPYCYADFSLKQNVDSILASLNNTLQAGLFAEFESIKTFNELCSLSKIVKSEKQLIFDFLIENNLTAEFNLFVDSQKEMTFTAIT